MTRLALLVGSFLLTFALLSATWMLASERPANVTSEPTPLSTPTETATPLAAPVVTPRATPNSEPSPLASPNEPAATPDASGTDKQTLTVVGSGFVESQVPDGGSITPSGDGVALETTESASDALWVTYRPDQSELPVGVELIRVDIRVCGDADGQFWKLEGPAGSTPTYHEIAQPETDGCWHFSDAPAGDLSVTVSTMLDSRLHIEMIEFSVTFAT